MATRVGLAVFLHSPFPFSPQNVNPTRLFVYCCSRSFCGDSALPQFPHDTGRLAHPGRCARQYLGHLRQVSRLFCFPSEIINTQQNPATTSISLLSNWNDAAYFACWHGDGCVLDGEFRITEKEH